ncbi:MAG: hypothetical protein CMG06_04825 [Candidatus Marinimicrobia bacterium]|jgi:excisionase family DNA binding protein|nr:hypothetical protein [Candidatus Neomarinimicrobiota bacterium]MBR92324.1 hypothetical protein [Dehalococcoidia bacterium]MDC0145663.1 helix-turn-helix domain-containing protein [bacterium]RPG39009.1 MAG: DNA-binding protein [Gammaproteobacteria bacterium TMED186]|tara:strand:+ start:3328 stop:3546 length:219 start_codon:yes stop_codon:yes gene_type:complete
METRLLHTLNEIKSFIKNETNNRWLDIKKVAQMTSVSQSTIRRAVQKGELKASHTTGKLLFRVEEIERWLNG